MITRDVQDGLRYRVTLLKDVAYTHDDALEMIGTHGPCTEDAAGVKRFTLPKLIEPTGTVYEGVASDVDEDGFFDLSLATGEKLGFYAEDEYILIEYL